MKKGFPFQVDEGADISFLDQSDETQMFQAFEIARIHEVTFY